MSALTEAPGAPDAAATQSIDKESRAILRSSAEASLRRAGGTKLARAVQRREADALSSAWKLVVASGWSGALADEARGGSGLGVRGAATIAEALGRVALPLPYVAQCIFAAALLNGTDSAPLLERIASGQARVSVAHDESTGSAAAITGHARSLVLSGRKSLVAGADAADHYIVSARRRKELALCVVRSSAPGVSCSNEYAVDGTCYGTLAFDTVRLSDKDLVATGSEAEALFANAYEHALVAASAELLGVMSEALEMTLGYMRTRMQFGRPIGAFQALQHRAADLFIQKELAYSVLNEAIELVETGRAGAERSSAVHRAKARCSDAALRITKDAIQLHGAIGYTDEYDLSLYLKRAMVLASWLGNGVAQRREYVRLAHAI